MNDDITPALALKNVDGDRLLRSIDELSAFGGRADGGVGREALSNDEIAARNHLIERAISLGCRVDTDPCGNLFFTRAGTDSLSPVVTGSHIDTQPAGGKLDGAFGVLAGLEVIAALADAGIKTSRPVTVVIWTNEEGCRFKPGAMGSSAFVDPTLLENFKSTIGTDGALFSQALSNTLGATKNSNECAPGFAMHAYLEAHIEQGPILEQSGLPLAVVTGIQGVRWYEIRCEGYAAHAGTTPMSMRRDAIVLANDYLRRILDVCAECLPDTIRITCGRWQVSPNSINTIASEVVFTLDVRSPDARSLDRLEAVLDIERRKVDLHSAIKIERTLEKSPVAFDENLQRHLAIACRAACGTDPAHLMSGAFHDAINLVGHCPTAMIFVPSIGGVSHNPAEATKAEDLVLGTQALAYAVTYLAM